MKTIPITGTCIGIETALVLECADYLTIDYYTNLRNGNTIKYLVLQCY